MLPLGAQTFPATSDELLTSLTTGLAGVFQLPPRPIALASGAAYPILDTLHVDLSGARIRDEFRPAPPHSGVVFVRSDLQPPRRIAADGEAQYLFLA